MNGFLNGLTYGQLLALFLVPPILGAGVLVACDRKHGSREQFVRGAGRWWLLMGMVGVAIVYTIPWDNHLIAEGVWSYDAGRVSGIRFDRIPIEELLFFPLQTILVGLWVLWLTRRVPAGWAAGWARRDGVRRRRSGHLRRFIRWGSVVVVGVVGLVGLAILLRGWRPGTYLGWELVWALPPLALQLGLGGDLLWRYWRVALTALLPMVVYLSVVDAVAIHAGIWTIAPERSLGILLGGVLPLEEFVFFLLSSALVTGGLIVGMAPEMRKRLEFWRF